MMPQLLTCPSFNICTQVCNNSENRTIKEKGIYYISLSNSNLFVRLFHDCNGSSWQELWVSLLGQRQLWPSNKVRRKLITTNVHLETLGRFHDLFFQDWKQALVFNYMHFILCHLIEKKAYTHQILDTWQENNLQAVLQLRKEPPALVGHLDILLW